MSELPLILVLEDEYPLQGIVEEALTEGGFEADILSSGEEALTLFKGGSKSAAADDWGSQGVPNSILLQKPFAPAQLVTALAQLLNAAPPIAPET